MRENKRLSFHSIVWTVVWKTPLKRFSVLRDWSTGVWCTGHSASEARQFKRERDEARRFLEDAQADVDDWRSLVATKADERNRALDEVDRLLIENKKLRSVLSDIWKDWENSNNAKDPDAEGYDLLQKIKNIVEERCEQ